MALAELDRILEVFKQADAKKMHERELQQQQARDESMAANRLAEQDARDKQFQELVKQNAQQNEIAKRAADLQHSLFKLQGSKVLQDMGESYQKTGVAPGAQVSPAATSSTGGSFTPTDPSKANQALIQIPGLEQLGSIQVATPEAAAVREANLSRITDRPKVEAKIEESRALQADLLKKQEEAKQADFLRTAMMKTYDDERADKRNKADDERARLQRESMERIARIQRGASDTDLTPYVAQVIDGDLSKEDVLRLPIPKPDQMRLINAVTGSGAGLLNNSQKELVGDFSQMVQAVKFMDEIISNQGQNHNIISSHIGGAIDTFNQSVKGASDELSGRTSLLARGFAKEKGNLSNQDITRVQKMLPSRFDPVETNVKKRNDYIAELSKTIDAKLSNVPQKQRDMIKKKVGLFDIGLASVPGASKPTNSSPAAAGAATHIWTPDGVQPVGVSK